MNNVLLDFAARKLGARASAAEALVERASNHALAMRMHGARLRGLPGAMLLEDLCDAISGKYEPEGLVEDGDELTDRMTVAEGMKMLGIQKFEAFAVAINASVGSMKERRHAGQARQDRASPENFDAELGRKIARQNAVAKLWPLMGYELKQRLHNHD